MSTDPDLSVGQTAALGQTASGDGAASSRAAEVLERMVRDRHGGPLQRRSWQLRQLTDTSRGHQTRSVVPSSGPDPGDSDDATVAALSRRLWRPGAALLGALAVIAVVVALVVARRPPPIEERLPVATADPAAPAGREPQASGEPPTAPGTGSTAAGPATSGSAAGGQAAPLVVHVAGAVAAPGVVRLPAGSRVVDAVAAAGGMRPDAEPDRVNLAAPLTDGQRVVVPVLGQPDPVEVAPPAGPSGPTTPGGPASGAAAPVSAPIDLNSATAEQLDSLPGVGPATAAAIIDHRSAQGPFRSVDDLIDVRGIGEAKLEGLRDLVTVGGVP